MTQVQPLCWYLILLQDQRLEFDPFFEKYEKKNVEKLCLFVFFVFFFISDIVNEQMLIIQNK